MVQITAQLATPGINKLRYKQTNLACELWEHTKATLDLSLLGQGESLIGEKCASFTSLFFHLCGLLTDKSWLSCSLWFWLQPLKTAPSPMNIWEKVEMQHMRASLLWTWVSPLEPIDGVIPFNWDDILTSDENRHNYCVVVVFTYDREGVFSSLCFFYLRKSQRCNISVKQKVKLYLLSRK